MPLHLYRSGVLPGEALRLFETIVLPHIPGHHSSATLRLAPIAPLHHRIVLQSFSPLSLLLPGGYSEVQRRARKRLPRAAAAHVRHEQHQSVGGTCGGVCRVRWLCDCLLRYSSVPVYARLAEETSNTTRDARLAGSERTSKTSCLVRCAAHCSSALTCPAAAAVAFFGPGS